MKTFVTGGAGFIGSCLIRQLIHETNEEVYNIDNLTYSGNLESLLEVHDNPRYHFYQCDILDGHSLRELFQRHKPQTIIHLAAETHVDRSIDGPKAFITTNILGTYSLLEAAREFWLNLSEVEKWKFRFHHVSTDEVYGSLGPEGYFSETTAYDPSSPYSASKASSDHLVRAWMKTFGLPCTLSNCSNNYGPFQFPEKLIPLMIISALHGKLLPVYGDGLNIRDWLYVEDHCIAIRKIIQEGKMGETYNIGGHSERTNLQVVQTITSMLDEIIPDTSYVPHNQLITFVKDRPAHDRRYAIDSQKIEKNLNWKAKESFESGIRNTILWYLEHRGWWQNILDGTYQGQRLGVIQ